MIDEKDIQPDMQNLPMLRKILTNIHQTAAGLIYTDTVPTLETTPMGKLVIYDNGTGTKRIYLKTGKNNLGYLSLT